MLYFMDQKIDCTGCAACAVICPKKCISMLQDDEGFWYPQASIDCIKCGKCQKVCPSIHSPVVSNKIQPVVYAGLSKDNHIWKRSTSGGAFSELCYAWAADKKDDAFGGAVWNGLSVEEKVIQGYENIAPLCKSKYVASYLGDCYSQLKKVIFEGKKVVFCGTPCQIAGLRKYLEKEYDNLLLIDLICHGVGSPLVFNTCMEEIGKQFEDKVIQYEFCTKRKVYEQDYLTKIDLKSGKKYYLYNDPYMQLFLSLNALRPCCVHKCRYRNRYRMGDITIADFKGLLTLFPDLAGEEMSYSTIVVNTEKGLAVRNTLQRRMKLLEIQESDIIKFNPLFDHDTHQENDRENFFKKYKQSPNSTVQQYTKNALIMKRRIKKKIYESLPVSLRKKIQQKIRGDKSDKKK